MGAARRSALAEQDYRDIWHYIAADGPVVFYRIVSQGIELVRVLHGARDLKKLLNP